MAVSDSNFQPKIFIASLALLHDTRVLMKKKFLKLVKRHANHWPKTIGRIVPSLLIYFEKHGAKLREKLLF